MRILTRLWIVLLLCAVSNACRVQEQKLEKTFVYPPVDGAYGIIRLEYKPNFLMARDSLEDGKKISATCYIVEHYLAVKPEAKIGEKRTLEDIFSEGVMEIQFFDKNGNALADTVSTIYVTRTEKSTIVAVVAI